MLNSVKSGELNTRFPRFFCISRLCAELQREAKKYSMEGLTSRYVISTQS